MPTQGLDGFRMGSPALTGLFLVAALVFAAAAILTPEKRMPFAMAALVLALGFKRSLDAQRQSRPGADSLAADDFRMLSGASDLEQIGQTGLAVIYKHSTACGISSRARGVVSAFAREAQDIPVYLINVLEQRSISDAAAARYAIPHASPQALVIRGDQVLAHTSHSRITDSWLRENTKAQV